MANPFEMLQAQLGATTEAGVLHLEFRPAADGKEASYRNATQVFPAGSVAIAVQQGWFVPESVLVDGNNWTLKLKDGVRPFRRPSGIWGFTDKVQQTAESFA